MASILYYKTLNMKKIFLLIFLFFFFSAIITPAGAQTNPWSDIPVSSLSARKTGDTTPVNFRALALDLTVLKNSLASAPLEASLAVRNSQTVIALPLPDGSIRHYRVVESPIMEKDLADKFPEIKTYQGQDIEEPAATVRFDLTPLGFHAMIIRPDGFVFIEPYTRGNIKQYIVYYQKDLPAPLNKKFCELRTAVTNLNLIPGVADRMPGLMVPSGSQLRTYRLAMAATGEYTALNGGTVALALSALATVVNQVDAIYESEVAIRFVLVGNNNKIIFTNAATDPYSNTAGNPCSTPIRSENQTACDDSIGSANYDIGHVFIGTNIGGCAAFSVVCGGSKAWGASGVTNGGAFDVGLTAHEMGHQFSAQHTFNSNIGTCLGAQYAAGAAYEPGSGTTIMSYAGTCHDIQGFRDMFFHTKSYDEIINFSVSGGGNACPVTTATGNAAPAVNAGASGFTIPINTPFTLTGSGSDANGDALTFSWEQFDLGPQSAPNSPSGNAPIFRSFPPVNNPSRTFPQLSDILNNTQTLGEILPSYGRTLNFRLTARDNRANGGGVEYASMSMTVDGASGPFVVTAPNTAVNWCPGTQTVTWDVANTNMAPISVANVKISLSTDGGNTFPIVLLAVTPNDGSESVNIPCTYSTQARIKVEADGNVFFDISNASFTTGDNTDPTFTAPPSITIYKDANCNYTAPPSVTGDVTDEDDNCDLTLNATFSDVEAAGSCAGEIVVTRTWTLTDDCGNSTSHDQIITVTDNTPPTFTVPPDVTVYKDANCDQDVSTGVTGDVTDEADNCDNTLDATYTDGLPVPGSCIGNEFITRTWTLTDDCGNTVSHNQLITVLDTLPPVIANISPDPPSLWPPNHKMKNVTINYTDLDNCSPPGEVTTVLTVSSDEPINGTGDGNTSPDWIVLDDHQVMLRAERAGNGNGRTYTIFITATDDCGNTSMDSTHVIVQHDKSSQIITSSVQKEMAPQLEVKAFPNPSAGNFIVHVKSNNKTKNISMQVADLYGRIVEVRSIYGDATIMFGAKYAQGTYFVSFSQGTRQRQLKLIKLKN